MRTRKANLTAAIALAALLTGCGGGGSGGQSSAGVTPAPAPAPAPVSTPTPSPAPVPTPSPGTIPSDWNTGRAALYSALPDIAACRTGTMSSAGLQDALQSINTIRALHRLPPVTLSSTDQQSAMEAALMMAANNELSHTPPASWRCYTAAGAAGAGSSNLYGSFPSAFLPLMANDSINAGFMTEVDNLVADSVGHRRWILSPFIGTIAYGRVAAMYDATRRIDTAALKVFNNSGGGSTTGTVPDYVAYPFGDYPARYFDSRAVYSFTVIADKTTTFGGNTAVDFSDATITVRPTAGGASLAVSNIAYDNQGYGVPNNLQWKVAGAQAGVSYDVAIANVRVRGVVTSYGYSFRIVS